MSHQNNTLYLESVAADFDEFLAKGDFENAKAIVDNLYDTGMGQYAVELHKMLVSAQKRQKPATPYEIMEASMSMIDKGVRKAFNNEELIF